MLDSLREDVLYGYEQNQTGIWCGLAYRYRRCAPRSRPESCFDPHRDPHGEMRGRKQWNKQAETSSFLDENRRKALYSRGWKALRQLVRMRSAVRICPAAPSENPVVSMATGFFFCLLGMVFPLVFPYESEKDSFFTTRHAFNEVIHAL